MWTKSVFYLLSLPLFLLSLAHKRLDRYQEDHCLIVRLRSVGAL